MVRHLKLAARVLLGVLMVAAGVLHFTNTGFYLQIMPPYLPWHRELVYVSGVFEVVGGVGLFVPRLRVAAAWGLIALFVAVFPANIHMAVNDVAIDGEHYSVALRYGRLPFQALFIAWAYWFTYRDARAE